MAALHVEKIALSTFRATLERYPEVASSALAELDVLRYETVPLKLASMEGKKYLLRTDVEKLVEWKLKHGTFRPALMGYVKSNPADLIKSTTESAFSSFDSNGDVLKALKALTKLRGIGPATASLLLNVYQPDVIPFFSDELFRWMHWDGSQTEEGWDRKIKYNVKEYDSILERVGKLRKRLGIGATEIEKVAYVLGTEQADIQGGSDATKGNRDAAQELVQKSDEKKSRESAGEEQARVDNITKAIRDAEADIKDGESKLRGGAKASYLPASEDPKKKGTKRKVQEQQATAEGTRRSTRTRT